MWGATDMTNKGGSFGRGCGVGRGRGFSNQFTTGTNIPFEREAEAKPQFTNYTTTSSSDMWDDDADNFIDTKQKPQVADGWDSEPNNQYDSYKQNVGNSNEWDESPAFLNGNNEDYDQIRGGGVGKSNKGCFKCGEDGHISRDCSKNSFQSGGKKDCYKCGGSGHISKDCTSSNNRKSSACFKCGEEGHMSRDCTNSDSRKGSACYKCGEEGHMSRDCTNSDSRKGSACYKCGEEGHISRDCTNSDNKKGSGCFKCGKDGHMAKDCTESKPGTTQREAPYIPPDPIEDESKLFDSVPTGINFSKYDKIPVEVTGQGAPPPLTHFEDANFLPTLSKNIQKLNYTKPTPVQKYAIPIILAKRDLMACAQTGSGKTAAFLLPIIQTMFESNDLPNPNNLTTQEPWAVIISPTRELAIQIYNEARKFSFGSILKVELIYGGTSVGHQSSRLRRGCHILVATPGRLLDFIDKDKVSFSQLRYLILDEADRMLDLGFIPEIRRMVQNPSMPPKGQRQTLMFSATFPPPIQRLASEFLDNYLFLTVGIVGSANSDVEQTFYQVSQYDKRQKLTEILSTTGTDRTLVFVEQKRTADFIASFMSQNNYPTTSIHGDRLQREREEALMDFRTGRMPILVATAVAARGLDIKDVRHVINYDLPKTIQEYVHRIGRTGRVGNLGKATSFFDPDVDSPLAADLVKILQDSMQIVPDWLEAAGGHTGMLQQQSFAKGSRYGAKDVRNSIKDSWEDSYSSPKTEVFSVNTAEDESWD
ncbi:ATP-dependent RNA helicase vasa-like isoform X2 [Centruroides sculpturatus]|uniref:ATP-dependent RNA helicase vasa-like isoform X2 n=1 Tax=Centruroides sculpturatus TaxID=218467 RepID=UPI000C6ECEAE|nr:ATP-dependent RNA helicase vasa-like isoform X2 [Centruroides sculpturatus]